MLAARLVPQIMVMNVHYIGIKSTIHVALNVLSIPMIHFPSPFIQRARCTLWHDLLNTPDIYMAHPKISNDPKKHELRFLPDRGRNRGRTNGIFEDFPKLWVC